MSFSLTVGDSASTERLWHHTDRQQWLPGITPRGQTQQAGLSPLPGQAGLQHRGHPGWWKVPLPRGKFFYICTCTSNSQQCIWMVSIYIFLILTFCYFLILISHCFLPIENDNKKWFFFFVDIYQFFFWLNCFISFFELSIFRLHCTDPLMYSTGCLKREQIQTNKTVRFHIKHKCKH